MRATRAGWGHAPRAGSTGPGLSFPVSGAGPSVAQIAGAQTVCAGPEVRSECLAFALSAWQPYGVWGGTSPEERTTLRNKARAAGLADAAMVS